MGEIIKAITEKIVRLHAEIQKERSSIEVDETQVTYCLHLITELRKHREQIENLCSWEAK